MDRGPWTVDRGPRTGVAGAVSASDLHYVRGWGRRARAAVRGSRTLVDGFIKKELISSVA